METETEADCCAETAAGCCVEKALLTSLLAAEGGNAEWACGCGVSHPDTSTARTATLQQLID